MTFSRRGVIATVLAGLAVAAILGGTRMIAARMADTGSGECGRPAADVAGPTATATDGTYWTEERRRNAKPADPAREGRDAPRCH